MIRFNRFRLPVKSLCLAALFLCNVKTAYADPFVDTILKKYGSENFKNVKEIRFTFNAKILGLGPSRSWIWNPKADSVTRVDKKISYSRKSINADAKVIKSIKDIDAEFVNDQYWLIFPLLLGSDKSMSISVDTNLAVSPIKKELLRKVTVSYPKQGGYTPGDVYDLFVDESGLMKEWVYHKGGKKSGLKWTWEKHEVFSGVMFSMEHPGSIHVFFTNIKVILN